MSCHTKSFWQSSASSYWYVPPLFSLSKIPHHRPKSFMRTRNYKLAMPTPFISLGQQEFILPPTSIFSLVYEKKNPKQVRRGVSHNILIALSVLFSTGRSKLFAKVSSVTTKTALYFRNEESSIVQYLNLIDSFSSCRQRRSVRVRRSDLGSVKN